MREKIFEYLRTLFMLFGVFTFMMAIVDLGFYGLGGSVQWRQVILIFAASLLLAVSKSIISSEELMIKSSRTKRLLLSIIPAVPASGILVYLMGFQNMIRGVATEKNVLIATVIWIIFFILSALVLFFVFFLVNRKYLKEEKEYIEALEQYKNETEQ